MNCQPEQWDGAVDAAGNPPHDAENAHAGIVQPADQRLLLTPTEAAIIGCFLIGRFNVLHVVIF
jgi:hypothetical protein